MKTLISMKAIGSIEARCMGGLTIEVDMTETQMFSALNQFLHFVTDETWAEWQQEINGEIYGDRDLKRYQFLRDKYAMNSGDDEGEFKKLAKLSGKEFDAAIDSAMEAA